MKYPWNSLNGLMASFAVPLIKIYQGHLEPFYQSLNQVQKLCLVIAIVLLPVYLIQGQLFLLFDAIALLINGERINLISFTALLSETTLLLYMVFCYIIFSSEYSKSTISTITIALDESRNGFLEVSRIPRYLFEPERPIDTYDDSILKGRHDILPPDDASLLEVLGDNLSIYKDKDKMEELYNQYNSPGDIKNPLNPSETNESQSIKTTSLYDLIKQDQQIDTAEDFERIISNQK